MSHVLGLDIGTTSISGVVVDCSDGRLLARATRDHRADVPATEPDRVGWAEQDPTKLWQAACTVLGQLADAAGPDLAAIGLTGQMHGAMLLDANGRPVGNLITWQDRRSADVIDDLIGSAPAASWSVTGCRLATGYMAATLAWMVGNDVLPPTARRACFVHDWVAARLANTDCCTDPSDAGSAGILDLSTKAWSADLVAALGLPADLLAPIRESGEVIGQLPGDLAKTIGFAAGVPVCNAIGDNQASFLGSVSDAAGSVLINIGTGGQISWVTDEPVQPAGMEVRYLPIDRFIAVGAGICGGRTYAWLEEFYRRVVEAFASQTPAPGDLYEAMNALAADAPPDADGLRCRPTLSGTREDPAMRGLLDGLDLTNMTPQNLTRAVLTGMVDELRRFYDACPAEQREGHRLVVASGNAVRRNRVLADIIADRFGLNVTTPQHNEEAAYGAALLASASAGVHSDLAAAQRMIRTVSATPTP